MENEEQKPPEAVEQTTIQKIEALKGTTEFQQLLSNSNNSFFEANVGGKLKDAYGHVDNAFTEVLGLSKPEGKKTSEWAKEIALEYKTLKDNRGDTTKLDEAIEQGKQLSKAQIATLKAENLKLNTELQAQQLQGVQNVVNSELSNVLTQKTFNPAFGETELKELLDIRKNRLVNNSKRHEGKTIYYKDAEKTQPYLDTLGEPMKVDQVANEVFGSLYQTKKAGGNADPTGVPTVEGDTVSMDMSKITTFSDFNKQFKQAMATQGITEREPKYLKIMTATSKKYKIGQMPLE